MGLETTQWVTIGTIIGLVLILWLAGRVLKKRLPERWADLIGQLVPVAIFAIVVVGLLVIIDPDQASSLLASLRNSVPDVMMAVVLVILARALGRIVGMIVEQALRGVSASLAGRARLLASGVITAIGLIMAMQQLGVSTNIILILVAALAFGTALTVALGVGLGSVPIARQIAAGRHVSNRYAPGERVRVGDVEGVIMEIGLATTRIKVTDVRHLDVPNIDFLAEGVAVEMGGP